VNLEATAREAATARGYEWHAVDPLGGREHWLALRDQDVTASVAGGLFGIHEFRTPWQLWARKCGFMLDTETESAAMRRGRLLEPVALHLLGEEHCATDDRLGWLIDKGRTYYRDPVARIGCTPDGYAVDPEREGFGIVQIKSVEQSVFRRKWRNDIGEIEPPLWIALQALIEAELTGASWACVAALIVGYGLDLHVVDVPLNPGVITRLRERVAEFWRCVEAKEPPPMDYERDGEMLLALHPVDDGSTIDLTGWNRAAEITIDDAKAAAAIKDAKARRDAIKAELLDKMGKASTAMINGKVWATAKTVMRKAYTVQATSYRDVRIKGDAA
jgi:YqaJ-like viral recombinase domain